MGAKPCAPVCLSASPSWAPRGTRDREGQTQGEREGEREGVERETDTEGERKRSQGAGVKKCLQRKQSSETSPLFALFSNPQFASKTSLLADKKKRSTTRDILYRFR